jgi:transcription factor WhiB
MSQTIPLWWYGGDPDSIDFLDHPGRKCRNMRALYFEEGPIFGLEALAMCRSLCAACPVRHPCARYSIRHYNDVPDGIWAGYSAAERQRIYTGRKQFYDWARGWSRRVQSQMLARAIAHKQRVAGLKKRQVNLLGMPVCPEGHTSVHRTGRDKEIGRQLYRCLECRLIFTGEEL